MHPSDARFARLLEGLDRQQTAQSVARHGADAYDKCFSSCDHPLVLIFAQLSPAASLRGLEVAWAHAAAHPHLGTGPLHRPTLSDANQRRPLAVFTETFARLAGQLDRSLRRDLLRQGLFEPQTWAEVRALLPPRPASTPRSRSTAHAS